MGCNGKDKHFRTNRKFRLVRPDSDHSSNSNGNVAERSAVSNSSSESGISPSNCEMCAVDLAQNPNPNPNPNLNGNSTFEGNGLGFFTEEKLEEMLMQNLEFVCKDVISKLVSLGYDEDVALKAVLSNGFGWHGEMDVMANIFQNSLSYLDGGNSMRSENPEPSFSDLGQMLERTLAGMICFLQQNKPHLSKEDAMWCLLVTELHVGHASTLEMPVLSPPNGNGGGSNVEGIANGPIGFPSAMYRFRGGGSPDEISMNMSCSCSSDSCLEREFEYPKKFNLTPPVKSLLKRNVAVFSAGLRANTKHLQNQTQASLDSVKIGDSLGLAETGSEESPNFMNDGAINSVLSKFRDLHIQSAETGRIQIDQKDETILSLIHQIKDLERQVKERKEWAHQKAMQAARKLCNDLAELKMLRTERDETQLLKKGKQAIEDNTVKKLAEMENALRKASGQVDRANSAVKKLENENAEIRAEMEASKLSASESQKTYMEATKREKKFLKKLSALEKQRSKLQDDIAAEKHKISALQKQLAQAEAGQNEAEVKWRQEQKAKEQASAQVEEERRNKEAAEASNKRRLEAMRLKIEIDFQRHKDDLHRLEQELSQLKALEQTSGQHLQSHDLSMQNLNGTKSEGNIMHEIDTLEDSADGEAIDHDRRCIICSKDEASVVFLPCAHQVLCAKCNNSYGKKGKAACPCCQVPIQKRICVFGASS